MSQFRQVILSAVVAVGMMLANSPAMAQFTPVFVGMYPYSFCDILHKQLSEIIMAQKSLERNRGKMTEGEYYSAWQHCSMAEKTVSQLIKQYCSYN